MNKIKLKSKREIELLKEGGEILIEALLAVKKLVNQAATQRTSTKELDVLAEKIIRSRGAEPSFLGYSQELGPFSASLCVSINDEIVHGLPSENRFLKAGDLVKLDLGVKYKGLFTDAAITVPVGKISSKAQKIIQTTQRSLELGLEQIYPGSTLGNYGNAVEKYTRKNRLFVVKGLVGHGVGYAVHEPPQILNFGKPGTGLKLEEGMVLALEPMVNELSEHIELATDGFTFKTVDAGISAHFEVTVAVTKSGCEVLTDIWK